jgi:hypothetical protein
MVQVLFQTPVKACWDGAGVVPNTGKSLLEWVQILF